MWIVCFIVYLTLFGNIVFVCRLRSCCVLLWCGKVGLFLPNAYTHTQSASILLGWACSKCGAADYGLSNRQISVVLVSMSMAMTAKKRRAQQTNKTATQRQWDSQLFCLPEPDTPRANIVRVACTTEYTPHSHGAHILRAHYSHWCICPVNMSEYFPVVVVAVAVFDEVFHFLPFLCLVVSRAYSRPHTHTQQTVIFFRFTAMDRWNALWCCFFSAIFTGFGGAGGTDEMNKETKCSSPKHKT